MLEVTSLRAAYGETRVIHGIDLSVAARARVAVLGRNGAGKSTLLKSLMNAGPAASGQIRFDGRDLDGTSATARSRMGMCLVPEDRRIFSNLTVMENLRIGASAAGKRTHWTPEAIVERFPLLEPLTKRLGNQLSGGQQQMLAVARGFASAPRLMLLDEPTEGLAPVIVSALATAVVKACENLEAALILCEQSIAFARRCTDHVLVIDAGQVVFRGDWQAFDADETVKLRYLAV